MNALAHSPTFNFWIGWAIGVCTMLWCGRKIPPRNGDAEIKRLIKALKQANDGFEKYERKFYLVSDEKEDIAAKLAQKTIEYDALEQIHRGHVEGTLCEQIEAERDALRAIRELERHSDADNQLKK